MRKRRNLVRGIIGMVVLASLFVGILATTSTPPTKAERLTNLRNNTVRPGYGLGPLAKAFAPVLDAVTSVIEVDGDISDNPAGSPDDWNTINCDGGNAVVKTGVVFDGLGKSIFTGGGSKDPELLGSWKHKDGSVPDKDELINAYAAKFTGASGDDILAFGADRYANDGTAFMGFWFFKNLVIPAADGRFRQGPLATDALSVHDIGDVLVLIEFTQGGAVATSKVFEWVGTGGSESGGTLNDITATAPAGSVISISNMSAQPVPGGSCPAWQHTPKTGPNGTIQTNAFFEGAINLDAFPALQGVCFSSFLAETRSSASVTATLKDFVLGQFNTCASIEVTKTADSNAVCAGHSTQYTYVVHNTSGVMEDVTLVDDNETPLNAADDIDVPTCMPLSALPLGEPTHFTLQPNDNAAGGTDQASYQCSRVLSVGSHTNIVTASGSFGASTATATDNETVVVTANPTADAGVDQSVCDTSPHIFNLAATVTGAPPGTITWSVDSNSTGAAVQISNTSAEDPTVTLNGFGSVTLKLFVSNPATGPSCVTAQDTVTLTLSQNPAANAGVDKQACETTASHVFALSDATSTVPAGGTRTWSVSNNTTGATVLISNVNAANPSITLQGFGSATLTQTITNAATGAGCTGASDSVVLTLNQNPVITIADVACNAPGGATEIMLTANVSAGGGATPTFSWSGPGITAGANTATITANRAGLYTVTVTNGTTSCAAVKSKQVGFCATDPPPAP
jgi:hypothetical protein